MEINNKKCLVYRNKTFQKVTWKDVSTFVVSFCFHLDFMWLKIMQYVHEKIIAMFVNLCTANIRHYTLAVCTTVL